MLDYREVTKDQSREVGETGMNRAGVAVVALGVSKE